MNSKISIIKNIFVMTTLSTATRIKYPPLFVASRSLKKHNPKAI